MMAGGTKLSCAVALLLTGCSGSDGKLTVRSLPVSPSMAVKPVPARIAEARGHFALGSVALALEGFRKAQRDDPNSTDALVGIAACYDRMGRFELSRRYYESALALAPADPTLLEAFARSLDFQGRPADAAEIRQELAARSPTIAPAAEQPAPVAVAAVTTPKAAPVPLAAPAASVTVALPPPAAAVAVAVPPAKSKSVTRPSVASATVKLPPVEPVPAPVAAASVTVKLPPAKPVSEPVAVAMLRQEPTAPKLAAKPLPVAKADCARAGGCVHPQWPAARAPFACRSRACHQRADALAWPGRPASGGEHHRSFRSLADRPAAKSKCGFSMRPGIKAWRREPEWR